MRKLVLLLLGMVVLSACSKYASIGENLYLGSHNGPPLIIPPPLMPAYYSNPMYILPEQTQDARVNLLPPIVTVSEPT